MGQEIVVTSAMIEAGVSAAYDYDPQTPYSHGDLRELVSAIAGAVLRVSHPDRSEHEAQK